jgi:hydrogenase expression/formation protein HypD
LKYLDEYREPKRVLSVAKEIAKVVTHPWTLMEICGGQTHSIVKHGLEDILPPSLTLVHGPGCPVCVTSVEILDRAMAIANKPGVIFTSFGDMLRVPGTETDLLRVKAQGGDVRVVYSPLDALRLARENPDRQVVFFAVGFETTAPANAMAVYQAKREGLHNFSILVSHVLVPPAMEAILSDPGNKVQGFLAAGHVCAVMGISEYVPLAKKYKVPIVVTGFEPLDVMQGILLCVRQLEEGRFEVENQYSRTAHDEGNLQARRIISEVFRVVDRKWRGLGEIPSSGLGLSKEYAEFDAETRFDVGGLTAEESLDCKSGEVLTGRIRPTACPAFETKCTPEHPLGAPMVSSEGACAAYYRYRRTGSMPPGSEKTAV